MYKSATFLEKLAYIKAVQKFCIYMLNRYMSGLGNYELWIIFRSGSVGFSPTWIFCKTFRVTWNYKSIPGHVGTCLASQTVYHLWPLSNKAISTSNPQLSQQPKTPPNFWMLPGQHMASENHWWRLHRGLVQILLH